MAQKHRRSNRENKKPKQDKTKVIVSPSTVATVFATPGRVAQASKRK